MRLSVAWALAAIALAPPARAAAPPFSAQDVARMASELDDPDDWPEQDPGRVVALCEAALADGVARSAAQTLTLLMVEGRVLSRSARPGDALPLFRRAADLPGSDPTLALDIAILDGTFAAKTPADAVAFLVGVADRAGPRQSAGNVLALAAVLELAADRPDDADRLVRAGLARDAGGQKIHAARAAVAAARGLSGVAVGGVDEFVRASPNRGNLAEMYDIRGNLLLGSRQYGGACTSLRRGFWLRTGPDAARDAQTAAHIAHACLQTGRPANAVLAARLVLETRPDEGYLLVVAARAEALMGDLGAARRLAADAVKADPADPAFWAVAADLAWAAGWPDDAKAGYEAALALGPASPRANLGRACYLVRPAGDARAALTASEPFLAGPDAPVWHLVRARAFDRLGDSAAARRELTAADQAVARAGPGADAQRGARARADCGRVADALDRGVEVPGLPPALLWLTP